MKKSELRSGDIVEFFDGRRGVIFMNQRECGDIVIYTNTCGGGFDPLSTWQDDLTDEDGLYNYDIVKVFTSGPTKFEINVIAEEKIWERSPEKRKMTLDEIEAELGYSIQIIEER